MEWKGDKSGFGEMTTRVDKRYEIFQFTELGQEAEYEVAKDLSAGLFPNAVSTPKKKIIIKRV